MDLTIHTTLKEFEEFKGNIKSKGIRDEQERLRAMTIPDAIAFLFPNDVPIPFALTAKGKEYVAAGIALQGGYFETWDLVELCGMGNSRWQGHKGYVVKQYTSGDVLITLSDCPDIQVIMGCKNLKLIRKAEIEIGDTVEVFGDNILWNGRQGIVCEITPEWVFANYPTIGFSVGKGGGFPRHKLKIVKKHNIK